MKNKFSWKLAAFFTVFALFCVGCGEAEKLPSYYDGREYGRTAPVEDQGDSGTCWAYASLLALENSLRPEQVCDFSEDHMAENPDFLLGKEAGGDYSMAMAYLLSWRGPIEETSFSLGKREKGPEYHVQEIQILPPGDRDAVKQAVLDCGGVQSSMYTTMKQAGDFPEQYNPETNAYCFLGNMEPNHDVVIVGWDDAFPKESFSVPVPGDGAFLCQNSWGEQFGDHGFFYVSYYDGNLGKINLCYPPEKKKEPYGTVYQSDLCGWIGQIGYGTETAWGANGYRANEEEKLLAVGFYAIDRNTDYEVYVASYKDGIPDFSGLRLEAEGHLNYAGYYTIPLRSVIPLKAGEQFLVAVKLTTPGAVHPIAVEYDAGDGKCRVDLSDGEGYLSHDGAAWERLEETYDCNVCLKAYTR